MQEDGFLDDVTGGKNTWYLVVCLSKKKPSRPNCARSVQQSRANRVPIAYYFMLIACKFRAHCVYIASTWRAHCGHIACALRAHRIRIACTLRAHRVHIVSSSPRLRKGAGETN